MKKFRRALVTGGAGFLGSHLCEQLVRDGVEVICIDNMLTGSRENVAHLEGGGLKVIQHDVVNPYSFDADVIFNFACPASPVHYQADAVGTFLTSVLGIKNALDLSLQKNAVLLQASTSEVYGDPHVHPQREAYWGHVNPIGPRACYDEGKRAAETLMFDYHRTRGAQIKVARIFNTYGPRMSVQDGRVVSNFIVQALRGEDITIYGKGDQTRSFCYVDDLIDGLLRLSSTSPEVTGPVNLGNPIEVTIAELAELIIELTGSRSDVISRPLPTDDPKQRCPDITEAEALLKWQPKVDLRHGLRRTIEYFDDLLAAPPPPLAMSRVTAELAK